MTCSRCHIASTFSSEKWNPRIVDWGLSLINLLRSSALHIAPCLFLFTHYHNTFRSQLSPRKHVTMSARPTSAEDKVAPLPPVRGRQRRRVHIHLASIPSPIYLSPPVCSRSHLVPIKRQHHQSRMHLPNRHLRVFVHTIKTLMTV